VVHSDGPSMLVVVLSSTAGILSVLALVFFLVRYLMKRRSKQRNQTICELSTIIKTNADLVGLHAMKQRADTVSDRFELSGDGTFERHLLQPKHRGLPSDQPDNSDYSVELEDILQLMARSDIKIQSFVDPHLRNELENKIQNSNEISCGDHAAILQLISRIEIESTTSLALPTPERIKLLQQRILEGPFTENHSVVLKLICNNEYRSETNQEDQESQGILPNCDMLGDIGRQDAPVVEVDLEITPGDLENKSLSSEKRDVLMLLKKCELELSFLSQEGGRKLIEEKLVNQEGPLHVEHLAMLQLISKIEIDSNLSMDPERKSLLQKRTLEGPLTLDHLCALETLMKLEVEISKEGNMGVRLEDHEFDKNIKLENPMGHELEGYSMETTTSPEIKSSFMVDVISSVEIKSSLFSTEEKAALQLMELRAKTNRIRQSLPDWVKEGLVPPRRQALQEPSVLSDDIELNHGAESGAVVISCSVRADIGFVSDRFTPSVQYHDTASSQQQQALENVFLQNVAISEGSLPSSCDVRADLVFLTDAVTPAAANVLDGVYLLQDPNIAISEEPSNFRRVFEPSGSTLLAKPSGIKAWIVWLVNTLLRCLASCLSTVLGFCFSRHYHIPDQGDSPELGTEIRE
jgi:hypothetical protein